MAANTAVDVDVSTSTRAVPAAPESSGIDHACCAVMSASHGASTTRAPSTGRVGRAVPADEDEDATDTKNNDAAVVTAATGEAQKQRSAIVDDSTVRRCVVLTSSN